MQFDWNDHLAHIEFKQPDYLKRNRGEISPYQMLEKEIVIPEGKTFKTFYYGIAVIRRLRKYSGLEKELFLEYQLANQQDQIEWLLQLSRLVHMLSKHYGDRILFDIITDKKEASTLNKLIRKYYKKIQEGAIYRHDKFSNDAGIENNSRLNVQEAAKYLDYKPSYLYKLTSENKIPHHKPPGGRRITFYKEEIDEWLQMGSKRPSLLGIDKSK